MIRSYKDLEVYKKSYAMALYMYQKTKKLPTEERYGLISQIKRASLSIALNIAEGYGKKASDAEFKRYLQMSLGSCNEMTVLTEFCKDLSYFTDSEYRKISGAYDEIGKMLNGLVEKWNSSNH